MDICIGLIVPTTTVLCIKNIKTTTNPLEKIKEQKLITKQKNKKKNWKQPLHYII